MNTLRDMTAHYEAAGTIEAILLRPARRAAMLSVDSVTALAGQGLQGDRYAAVRPDGRSRKRQLTLMQAEYLPLIAGWLGRNSVEPEALRRNLVISGLNLRAMKSPFPDQPMLWRLGDQVVIEITGPCEPCSRMQTNLGVDGYQVMRGHGGLTAAVLNGGSFAVGDSVQLCEPARER